MGDQLLEDLILLYSAAPESAVNTPATTTAGVKAARFSSFMPPIPRPDKLKSDEIGAGNEFGAKPRIGYFPPLDIPLSGALNTEFPAVLAARGFGGTVTNTLVSTGVYDHIVPLQTKAQGRVPKLTTLIPLLGGYDFIHASCALVDFAIEFGGGGLPRWSATMRNTGYSFNRAGDLDPVIVPPSPGAYHYVHPAGAYATYNNGALIDLGDLARLISGRCGLSQDVEVTALPKDPFRIAGDRGSGAYARRIRRGKRTAIPSIKAYMDDALDEWLDSLNLTDITALTYIFVGDPIGATAYNHEFEIVYPLSTLTVDGDTENRDAAITLSFDTDRDDAPSGNIATLRVRNGSATLA